MTGFNVKILYITVPNGQCVVYGDTRGCHIQVFDDKLGHRRAKHRWAAFYYAGEDGVLLGINGYGKTPNEAARDLWSKL